MCGVYKCKKIPSYLKWWLFVQRSELPPLLAPCSESTFPFLVPLCSPRCPYCTFFNLPFHTFKHWCLQTTLTCLNLFLSGEGMTVDSRGKGCHAIQGGICQKIRSHRRAGGCSQRCKDVFMLIWWPLCMWQFKNILACILTLMHTNLFLCVHAKLPTCL